jgi:hypothetical protein
MDYIISIIKKQFLCIKWSPHVINSEELIEEWQYFSEYTWKRITKLKFILKSQEITKIKSANW